MRRAHVGIAKRDDIGETGRVKGFDDVRTAVADAAAGKVHFFTTRLRRMEQAWAQECGGAGGEDGFDESAARKKRGRQGIVGFHGVL